MRPLILLASVPLCLTPALLASGGTARTPRTPRTAMTTVEPPRSEAVESELERAYAAVDAEYQKDVERARAEVEALRASDKYATLREAGDYNALNAYLRSGFQVDRDAYGRRFLELARAHRDDPFAPTVLGRAFDESGEAETLVGALELLVEDHPGSEALVDATLNLHYQAPSLGNDVFAGVCALLIESEAAPVARANAHYARSAAMARAARGADNLSEADRARYDADQAAVLELAPDSIAAYRVEAPTFQRERLQIGMTAPNIEGVDVFGEPLSLEQFRGKVVVLDFWGDW